MLVGKQKFSGGTDERAGRDEAMVFVLMGFIAISVNIFFAMRAFRTDSKGEVSTIRRRL